jgi:DNA-binding FadR family transcriptional regulator
MTSDSALTTSHARSSGLGEAVRRRLLDEIEAGTLKPGDRISTERELALRFGTSRGVVRAALTALDQDGRIVRHVGRGTFVSHPRPRLSLSLGQSMDASPMDFIDFRILVEPAAGEAAALHARDRDIERVMEAVRQGDAATTPDQFNHWDRQFHQRLAEASGNPIFAAIFIMTATIRDQAAWSRLKRQSTDLPRWEIYQAEHRGIAEALRARDADAVRGLLRDHLLKVRAKMLLG